MRKGREFELLTILAGGAVALLIAHFAGNLWWGLLLLMLLAVGVVMRPWVQRSAAVEAAEHAAALAETQRVQRIQETAHSVLNSLPYAAALVSPEGTIEIVNIGAARIGLEAGRHVADSPLKWLPALVRKVQASHDTRKAGTDGNDAAPSMAAPLAPAAAAATEKPGPSKDAFLQVFENGRELFFLPQANPVLNAQNELIGITVLLVDVTEQRGIREAKSSLLSTVSHQLKTPLTSMQMSIHLLLDDAAPQLNPRQMELLRTAAEDSDRLRREIEDLLATARERGR